MNTRHTLRVSFQMRDGTEEEVGLVTVEGQPYDLTEGQATDLVLPEGSAPTRLDFDSVPGHVRFGSTLVPMSDYRSLSVQVVSASKLD